MRTPHAYFVAGGVFVCRRNQLRAFILLGFGLGIMVGYYLDSWLLCGCGGGGLIILAFCMLNNRNGS